MTPDDAVRGHVVRLLEWHEAHVDLDAAVAGLAPALRGLVPPGAPHSPWQLLEHIRITQHDILDFCVNPAYVEKAWPDDYWPSAAAPTDDAAWDDAVAAIRVDRQALQGLARDPAVALEAPVPYGSGQTWLRELLLVADHTAYHLGQLVLVRQLLGAWGQ